MSSRKRRSTVGAAAAFLFICPRARAQKAVAVLSAASGSYQAAFESFEKTFGPLPSFRLPNERPAAGPDTKVVIAFGGEAASRQYPERATLIVCLAPGLAMPSVHEGPFIFVDMKPPAETLLRKLRTLQPGLKRLAVLWNSEDTRNYLKDLKKSAAGLEMGLTLVQIKDPGDVPDRLRALVGKVDALWLAPDPGLVTPEAFQTVKQFSWDNAVPFYAPTAGLVAAGAAASVSISARESGRQAAELARKTVSGEASPAIVYPDNVEVSINLGSSAKAGLAISPAMTAEAAKVIP